MNNRKEPALFHVFQLLQENLFRILKASWKVLVSSESSLFYLPPSLFESLKLL